MADSAEAIVAEWDKLKVPPPPPMKAPKAPKADDVLQSWGASPPPKAGDTVALWEAQRPTTPAPPKAADTVASWAPKSASSLPNDFKPASTPKPAKAPISAPTPSANAVVDSWDRLKTDAKTAYTPAPGGKGNPGGERAAAADRIGGDLMDLPASAVRQYINKPVSKVTGIPEDILGAAELAGSMVIGGGRGPSVGKPHVEPPRTARVYGNEAHPLERLDNALYRLGGHSTADKLEAQQFLKRLPKKLAKGADSPSAREELYHALEARIFDPKAEIPEHLKPLAAEIEPYRMEQTALINELRARKDPALEPYLNDQGYVARRVKGKSPLFDAAEGPARGDPILGKRVLNQKTTAQQQRSAGHMVTDADGKSFFARELNDTDIKGRPYASTRQATTKEIEANTDLRYHKDAVANTVDNVVRLRAVKRNLEVLDEMKGQLKEHGLAHQETWHYPDPATGKPTQAHANGDTPKGFVAVPQIKALDGWKFDPKVAQVLKDYYPTKDEGLVEVLGKVNRMMTASLFITPIPHAANVMAHWTVGRGWDWMTPGGYKRLASTGAQAAKEVLTLGPKYKQMLREGSGLLYGDIEARNWQKSMVNKATEELADPESYSVMDKAFGLAKMGIKSPVELSKAVYGASNKALWMVNDVLMLQRQLELQKKGMSTRMAIREAERSIPNYRVPSQVLDSRAMAEVFKNPAFQVFGRYKYGQLKAWGSMFNDLYRGDMAAKKAALGEFVVAAIAANVIYPFMDMGLKKLSGNDDARVKRSGGFALTDAGKELTTGQKDYAAAMSSVMTLSPAAQAAFEVDKNRDLFTGRPLIESEGTPAGQMAQGMEAVAGKAMYPAQLGIEAMKPGGGMSALGKLAGLELPPPDRDAKRLRAKKYSRSQARSREKKDALTQGLRPWMDDQ